MAELIIIAPLALGFVLFLLLYRSRLRLPARAAGVAALGSGLLVSEAVLFWAFCAVSENQSAAFVDRCDWVPGLTAAGAIPIWLAVGAVSIRPESERLTFVATAIGVTAFVAFMILPWVLFAST